MKKIQYRATFNGVLVPGHGVNDNPSTEIITVTARDINSGFGKALKRAMEPLGNGFRRELSSIDFWMIP